uniref:Qat anti-phage system associated protein QatB n=1 Tax=Enterocloster clostridioformis TaxID=1531 RepID=UPI0025A5C431|nr:Qat anti-phage system associated protein QatB [Enterocloster clostridioformis]
MIDMGTSASSLGPGSGVSFDPPWLNNIDIPNEPPKEQDNVLQQEIPIAPKARFRNARMNMGDYVKTGSKDSLRKSLGHYSKTGMGGARNVANRLRVSTSVAANLFQALHSLREGLNEPIAKIISDLKAEGADAYRFIDVIIDNVCPSGGSLDEISCKDSGFAALGEFFEKNPDADISNLSDDSLWLLTESFLGYEAFGRIQLDIGQVFERQDIPIEGRVTRCNEMCEYIKSEISAQINKIRSEAQTEKNLHSVLQVAIKNTFEVFEVNV